MWDPYLWDSDILWDKYLIKPSYNTIFLGWLLTMGLIFVCCNYSDITMKDFLFPQNIIQNKSCNSPFFFLLKRKEKSDEVVKLWGFKILGGKSFMNQVGKDIQIFPLYLKSITIKRLLFLPFFPLCHLFGNILFNKQVLIQ